MQKFRNSKLTSSSVSWAQTVKTMKKLFVILFVSLAAQLSWAQTSTPSKEWLKNAKEVVTTSNAWKSVNDVVSGGISPEMLNDRMWEDVLFAYPSHVQLVALRGDYTLVDNKQNVFHFRDTTLNVWVTDLSVPFYIPPGVDVDDPKFLLPIYDEQQRIIKSYAPSGQGQDVLVEAKNSSQSNDVAKVANVEWVEEDKAFFHEGRLYQKVGDEWKTNDPDAPRAIKAGDRKGDPTFIFSKNAEGEWEPTASNKRNGYKFGIGDYAGFSRNYYRHARNGAPLGGGWYGGPGAWTTTPMWRGGWNNWGWNGGWGFSAGVGVGVGFGWNNWSNGCFDPWGNHPYDYPYWGRNQITRFYPMLSSPTHSWMVNQFPVVQQGGPCWDCGLKSAEMPMTSSKSVAQPMSNVSAPSIPMNSDVLVENRVVASNGIKALTGIPATGSVTGNRISGSKPATTGISTEPRREVFSGIPATRGSSRTISSKEPGVRRTAEGVVSRPVNPNSGNSRTVQGGGKPNTGSPSLNRRGGGRIAATKPANRNSGNTRMVQGSSKPNTGSPSLNRRGGGRTVARPTAPVARQSGSMMRQGGNRGSSPVMRGGSANRGGGARPAASAPMRRSK